MVLCYKQPEQTKKTYKFAHYSSVGNILGGVTLLLTLTLE